MKLEQEMRTIEEYLDESVIMRDGPGFCECTFCVRINQDIWRPYISIGAFDPDEPAPEPDIY